ncbi:CoA transferase [Nocardia sp. alder85J]|uniref:CoA transferase n=1 Tax=Nocardia sp. alder85J TaxID=2862949 RepID=UPI001CD48684|nr:CaiB/BaiF CoA-transferase family protein [Nocardia sp. alder85J]MCX4091421.1 CaiB/BaiF CoA-transferase family protein [Nocardia sp. alder85J]
MSPAGPLAGTRVLELGGVGPVAFAGTVLADLGADVVRLERPNTPPVHSILLRGRRIVETDIRADPDSAAALATAADVVLEGFRPGVAERLGLGPEEILAARPACVYGRMSGWGRSGPAAEAPGHDINYAAVSGALHLARGSDGRPVVTPGLLGDFGGGGMTLVYGVLAALLVAQRTGRGQVVDCSILRSTATLTSAARELAAQGPAAVGTGAGAAPFYRAYCCADGQHVAVGAVESPFYAALRALCGLDGPEWDAQYDTRAWPDRAAELERVFATRTRDAWCADPAAAAACVSPVLDLDEAATHPRTTGIFVDRDGRTQPDVGPEFSGTPGSAAAPASSIDMAQARATWLQEEK